MDSEIVMLSEQELAPTVAPSYAKIPGFKFSRKSRVARTTSRGACEQICSNQEICHSYSYSQKEGKCLWSTEKLAYDPHFVFFLKTQDGTGSYSQFPGLVYHSTGWLKSTGKTNADCQGLCNKAAACSAYSYRAEDKLCLMTGKGIGFDDSYDYFEKQGVGHKEFALKPKTAVAAAKPTKAKAPKSKKPNMVQMQESAVKAAISAAKAAMPAAPVVQNGEPPSVVAERLRAVKRWASEKLKKKDEEERLKLKASEISNKAKLQQQQGAEEKNEAKAKIAAGKARADRQAARRTAAAQAKAQAMVKKVRLEATKASALAQLAQAAAEARAAKNTVEKSNKQVGKVKEVDAKKHVLHVKEAAEKTKQRANNEEQLRLLKEKDAKKNKIKTKVAVTEEEAAVTKKMSKKAHEVFEKTAERHRKIVTKEKSRKKTRKFKTSLSKELAVKADLARKAALASLARANKKEQAGKVKEKKEKGMVKVNEKAAKASESEKVKVAELKAKKDAKEKDYKNQIAKRKSKEQLRKNARVKKDVEGAAKAAAKGSNAACNKKVKAMCKEAYAAEKEVAKQASKITPAEKGDKMLEKTKQQWRAKISKARESCVPKTVKYKVTVNPTEAAQVAVKASNVNPLKAQAAGKKAAAQKAKPAKMTSHKSAATLKTKAKPKSAPTLKPKAKPQHWLAEFLNDEELLEITQGAEPAVPGLQPHAKDILNHLDSASAKVKAASTTETKSKPEKKAEKTAAKIAAAHKKANSKAGNASTDQLKKKGAKAEAAAITAKAQQAAKVMLQKAAAQAKKMEKKAETKAKKITYRATAKTKKLGKKMDPWPLDQKVEKTKPNGKKQVTDTKTKEAAYKAEQAAKSRGYQAISSGTRNQVAYFKFTVKNLKTSEVVTGATLKFRKRSGPAAAFVVKVTKCNYKAHGLTYKNRPIAVNAVSAGAKFSEADGEQQVALDKSYINQMLKKSKGGQVCLSVSGGIDTKPVYISDPHIALEVKKEGGKVVTSKVKPCKYPKVSVARRRRTAMKDSRRRRSVQKVKDKAKEMYEKNELKYKPEFVKEMKTKIPAAIEAKKLKIEAGLKQKYDKIIKDTIAEQMSTKFSSSAMMAEEKKLNAAKMAKAMKGVFPQKYRNDKLNLEQKMKAGLEKRMTDASEAELNRQVKLNVDENLKKEGDALIAKAIKKKVSDQMPSALAAAVKKHLAKDHKTALGVIVRKSVEEKMKTEVQRVIASQVAAKVKAQEGTVAANAAKAAVASKLSSLVQQKIRAEENKERARRSTLGRNLARGGSWATSARRVIKRRVARQPTPLKASEKRKIQQDAAKAAVAKLKLRIKTEVNARVRTKSVIETMERDLTRKETTRLAPIVKARIEKELTAKETPKVRTELLEKSTKAVKAQKPEILKTLKKSMTAQAKAKLSPKMQAKLAKEIPAALKASKFVTEVQGADAKLKEQLKTKMLKEMKEPMQQASLLKTKRIIKERKTKLTAKITTAKRAEMNRVMKENTATDKIQKDVEKELENKMKADLHKKVQKVTKEMVDRTLATKLVKKVKKKYEKGTIKKAEAAVMKNKANPIRRRIKAKAMEQAKAIVKTKLEAAKRATLKVLKKKLAAKLFEQYKEKMASKLKAKTKGMDSAAAKAVKYSMEKAARVKATTDAATQANIEMKSKIAKQLEAELLAKEKAKVEKKIDAQVKVALKAEAKRLAEKAVTQKAKDDLQAMQKGHAHTGPKSAKGKVKPVAKSGVPSVSRVETPVKGKPSASVAKQNTDHKATAQASANVAANDSKQMEKAAAKKSSKTSASTQKAAKNIAKKIEDASAKTAKKAAAAQKGKADLAKAMKPKA